ncbi:hypothetical protein MKW98_008113, partial [Papaver atlanticum]
VHENVDLFLEAKRNVTFLFNSFCNSEMPGVQETKEMPRMKTKLSEELLNICLEIEASTRSHVSGCYC